MNKSKVPTAQMRWFIPCILIIASLAVWGVISSQAMHGGSPSVDPNPQGGTYILTGHVYLRNGAGPAANAQVEMYGADNQTTTTDATGTFHFNYHAPVCGGSYCVAFKASMADPSCEPNHVRLDTDQFNIFCACGGGGTGYAADLYMASCNTTIPTPNPEPVEDKTVKPFPWHIPTGSDTDFVSPTPPDAFTRTKFRSAGPLTIPLPINRVIGTLNGDGTLFHPQELIDNQVVTSEAILSVPAYDVDYSQGERDHILFNGVEIGQNGAAGFLKGSDKTWSVTRFKIPIRLIHFGKRNLGGLPDPGQNEIKILIDQANANGAQRWAVSVGPPDLVFDAVAPVVMIHGNGSCGAFFSGNWLCNTLPRPPESEWFTHPFDVQRIPYDNSTNMPTQTVALHADWLLNGNDEHHLRSIKAIAAEFGAKHVNIVAHSKGGIDVRAWLALLKSGNTPGDIGVVSFTTLSSPHRGSVGADYEDSVAKASKLGKALSQNLFRVGMALILGSDPGKYDIRVNSMQGFNRTNVPALPRLFTVDNEVNHISYFLISADANTNGSQHTGSQVIYGQPELYLPYITDDTNGPPDETRGFPYVPRLENYTHRGKGWTLEQVYRLLGTVHEAVLRPTDVPGTFGRVKVMAVQEIPETGFFQVNDFAVTDNSALALNVGIPLMGTTRVMANHAVLSSASTADIVIGYIRLSHVLKLPGE